MCCGIAAISKEFTPLFFGSGYDECVILIIVLSPVLFIKGLSFIARSLFLIPSHMENKLTASVVIGAIVNLFVNLALIPKFGAIGAVVGTLVAELVACMWQYKTVIPRVNCIKSVLVGIIYFVIGIGMYMIVRFIAEMLDFTLLPKLIIEVIVGAIAYFVLCLLYWGISNNKEEFKLIKSLIKR
jgi:O-antigen/teichoic acid export membrane protein